MSIFQVYHILNAICVVGAALYLFQTYLHIRNVGRKMYILGMVSVSSPFCLQKREHYSPAFLRRPSSSSPVV